MLATHRQVATLGDYAFYLRDPGFEFTPVMLAKVASYIVQREDGQWTVCAFMYPLLLQLDEANLDETALLAAAVETLETRIAADDLTPRAELTFEYRAGGWVEVTSPRWWIPAFR